MNSQTQQEVAYSIRDIRNILNPNEIGSQNWLHFNYNKYNYNGRDPFSYLNRRKNMLKLYAIQDSVSKTTNTPLHFQTDRDAIDGFRELVNDDKTVLNKHPDDFSLWMVGEYDEREMRFIGGDPSKIVNASDLLN
jgi:hypothetical protein